VSEQFCSAVFVGNSGVGKSTMLNTVLMLTEVDEFTYASPAFHDTAPSITVPTVNEPMPTEAYRLEAIQA
jgi:ABC-type phosphate transport system ATPase subunit